MRISSGHISHHSFQTDSSLTRCAKPQKKKVFRWHKLAFRFLQESFFRTQTSDRLWKRLNTFKVLDYCWLFSVGRISVPEKFPHYSCIQYLIIERKNKKRRLRCRSLRISLILTHKVSKHNSTDLPLYSIFQTFICIQGLNYD